MNLSLSTLFALATVFAGRSALGAPQLVSCHLFGEPGFDFLIPLDEQGAAGGDIKILHPADLEDGIPAEVYSVIPSDQISRLEVSAQHILVEAKSAAGKLILVIDDTPDADGSGLIFTDKIDFPRMDLDCDF